MNRYKITITREITNPLHARYGQTDVETFDLIRTQDEIGDTLARYRSERGVLSVRCENTGTQAPLRRNYKRHADCREYEDQFGTVALLNDADSPYCGHCLD
jgi:hypothetical protein